MKTIAILCLCLCLASCAQTVIYRDGQPIARFQGDMTGVDYQDGDTRLRAATVDHSAATKAQGEAAAGKITAAGAAVAASGATLLLK